MRIMFEKLYQTYLGSTTQMCSIQFLKHDPNIFAYNVSEYMYIYVKKLNKMNLYDLKSLSLYSN